MSNTLERGKNHEIKLMNNQLLTSIGDPLESLVQIFLTHHRSRVGALPYSIGGCVY